MSMSTEARETAWGEDCSSSIHVPLRVPSGMRRSLRSLLPHLLVAGTTILPFALTAGAATEDPLQKRNPASSSARGNGVVENPFSVLEIERLIRDLDSNKASVREGADRMLRTIVAEWSKGHEGVPFPLKHLFVSSREGYSAEQQRRLEGIYRQCEEGEIQHMWNPTHFRVPAEWEGMQEPPTVFTVVKELERQIGGRIQFHSPKYFQDLPIRRSLDGLTLWEVMEELKKTNSGTFDVYRGSDGDVDIYPEGPRVYALNGGVYGKASSRLCSPLDDPGANFRQIDCTFLTELKVSLGDVHLLRVHGRTDKGRDVQPWLKVVSFPELGVIPRRPSTELQLEMNYQRGERYVDLSITVFLQGYEPDIVPVRDLSTVTKISLGSSELQILGTGEEEGASPKCWGVYATLRGNLNEDERWCLINAMRCRAFDSQGQPVDSAGFTGSESQWNWQFRSPPHTVELSIPKRKSLVERVFEFKGIPLN